VQVRLPLAINCTLYRGSDAKQYQQYSIALDIMLTFIAFMARRNGEPQVAAASSGSAAQKVTFTGGRFGMAFKQVQAFIDQHN